MLENIIFTPLIIIHYSSPFTSLYETPRLVVILKQHDLYNNNGNCKVIKLAVYCTGLGGTVQCPLLFRKITHNETPMKTSFIFCWFDIKKKSLSSTSAPKSNIRKIPYTILFLVWFILIVKLTYSEIINIADKG